MVDSTEARRNGTDTDGGQHWGTRKRSVGSAGAQVNGADTDSGQHWGT